MKEQIEKRIAELRAEATELEKQINEAKTFVNNSVSKLNAYAGAIGELEKLLKEK
jgi:peptidoglycan hydrolase CwlO-like protein